MIIPNHKALFVDIVKTGGTSIGSELVKFGGIGKHHSIALPLPSIPQNERLPKFLSEEVLSEYFIFTVVRNPFDRLLSLFAFCQQSHLQRQFRQHGWDGLLGTAAKSLPARALDRQTYWPTDFRIFAEWLTEHREFYCDYHGHKYLRMIDWLKDRKGNFRCDFVARYETLESDVQTLGNALGFGPIRLQRLNQSRFSERQRGLKALIHSKRLQSLVVDYYAEDFDYFNYPKMLDLNDDRMFGVSG